MLEHQQQTENGAGMDSLLAGFDDLAEELGMDEEIRDDLLRSFLVRCKGFLDSLQQSIENDDKDLFERTTHSLKGLSGNMRFDALNEANEAFTKAVLAEDTDIARLALKSINEEYLKLEKAITPLIGA